MGDPCVGCVRAWHIGRGGSCIEPGMCAERKRYYGGGGGEPAGADGKAGTRPY